MNQLPYRRDSLWLAAILATAITASDLLIELGVAVAVLHILVVGVTFASGSRRAVQVAAVATTVLTVAGAAFSPVGGEIEKVFTNRVVSVIAIWMTALLCLRVLKLSGEQKHRLQTAERLADEIAQQRTEDARKQRVMASIMEDLRIERERLAASELRTRATIESALDAVVTIDQRGAITDWNGQAERTFGWTRQEVLGQSMAELIIPHEFRRAHRQGMQRFGQTGEGPALNQRLEFSALRRSGDEFPVELTIAPLKLPDGYQFSAFIRDISRRKQSEQALAELAAIVESSDDAIIGKMLDGTVTSWNRGAELLYGYTAEEMVGQSINMLLPANRPDEQPAILELLRRGQPITQFETQRIRKDGTQLDVSLTISPIRDAHGNVVAAATIARDITIRKRLQLRLRHANQELEQSNKELQQFAYVASHDLQEPLRKISASCQLLKEEYGERLDGEAMEYLTVAIDGAERLRTLVRDLLTFSRITTRGKPLARVSSAACLREAISNLEIAIEEEGAQVTFDALPIVVADESQLVHLFQNLIGNALKYRGEAPPRIHVGGCQKGKHFEFFVRDNGIGIEAAFHERIFGIFQRLHNRRDYTGTGIGLALCKRIIERFGGRIWVESAAGAGSTFYFTMPITEEQGGQHVGAGAVDYVGASD